jgi:VIT family protein
MAAGKYMSVSSQRDAEQADIRLEARELLRGPRGELRELAGVLWWPPGKIKSRYLTPWLAALEEETVATSRTPVGWPSRPTCTAMSSHRRTRCSSRPMQAWPSRGRPAR